MSTFIVKGSVYTNPSYENIDRAHFIRVVATATTTVTIDGEDSTVLGEVYLHAAGDTVVIEKSPSDRITVSAAKVSAVGSPRS